MTILSGPRNGPPGNAQISEPVVAGDPIEADGDPLHVEYLTGVG